MPAPNEPPPDPSNAGPPAEGESSSASRLLEEIRERMERLEGNLSLRERRLARFEKALRDAGGKLQLERAKFSTDRDTIEKTLSQRLHEREKQLEAATRELQEHQKRLGAQLAREREALVCIERLTQERDQAATGLASIQQQLAAQRKRERELEARLVELDRRRAQWDHVSSSDDAMITVEARVHHEPPPWLDALLERLSPLLKSWGRMAPWKRKAVLALPLVCLLLMPLVYALYPTTWEISGGVVADEKDRAVLAGVAPAGVPGLAVSLPAAAEPAAPPGACLRMIAHAATEADARQCQARIAASAEDIVRRLAAPTTQPASFHQRQKRRRQLLEQLAALPSATRPAESQPGPTPRFAHTPPPDLNADPAGLLKELQATLTQREQAAARLAELNQRLAAKPPEQVAIPAAQLKATLRADAFLQADSEILASREAELSEALKKLIDAARPQFEDVPRTVTRADQALGELLNTWKDEDVADAVQTIRTSLADWSAAVGSAAATWKEQRAALDQTGPEVDPGARQATLETSAQKLLDAAGQTLASINKTLEALSQGGDEPVKRVTLRRDLTQILQPVLDVRGSLATAATRSRALENVELAALLGKVTGLRSKVVDRRARLEESLRRQLLADAQSAHAQEAAQLKQEREQVQATIAGLDQTVVRQAVSAFWLLRNASDDQTALLTRLNIEQLRAKALAELRDLDETDAREAAALPPPVIAHTLPPTIRNITPALRRVVVAAVGGISPLALAAAIVAAVLLRRYWRDSRESIEDYAKALRELPEPKPELEHQESGG